MKSFKALIIIMLLTFQATFATSDSDFSFIKTRTEGKSIKVFFNLTNQIDIESLSSKLEPLTEVLEVEISPEGYISLLLKSQDSNNEIRSAILSLGSDIDKIFITITNLKSFSVK